MTDSCDGAHGVADDDGASSAQRALEDALQELIPEAEVMIAGHWQTWDSDRKDFDRCMRNAIIYAAPAITPGPWVDALVRRMDRWQGRLEFVALILPLGLFLLLGIWNAPLKLLALVAAGFVLALLGEFALYSTKVARRQPQPRSPSEQQSTAEREYRLPEPLVAAAGCIIPALCVSLLFVVHGQDLDRNVTYLLYGVLLGGTCYLWLAMEPLFETIAPWIEARARLHRADPLSLLRVYLLILTSMLFPASSQPTLGVEKNESADDLEDLLDHLAPDAEFHEELAKYMAAVQPDALIQLLITSAAAAAVLIAEPSLPRLPKVDRARKLRARRVAAFIRIRGRWLVEEDDPVKHEKAATDLARATAAVCLEGWHVFQDADPQAATPRPRRVPWAASIILVLLMIGLPMLPNKAASVIGVETPLIILLLSGLGVLTPRRQEYFKAISDSVSALP